MTIIRDGLQSADLDFPVSAPTLNLDFANSQSLDERITFTRASVGTYVNRNGLVSIASTNEPRFDHDPITGECKGLLIEESRTNYFTNTNSLTVGGLNVLPTNDLNPDGSQASAYLISSSSTFHAIYNTINPIDISSLAVGETVYLNYSVYLKNYGVYNPYVLFGCSIDDPATKYGLVRAYPATKTMDTALASTGWTVSTKVVPHSNGWDRYCASISYTKTVGINTVYWEAIRTYNPTSNLQFYTGDDNSGIYIWGPQCEVGSSPSSFIPTYGSQVTRSSDNTSMTGTNFSNWYNQNEGTVYMESKIPYTPGSTPSVYFIIFGLNQNYRHLAQHGQSNEIGYFTQNGDYTLSWTTPNPIIPQNTDRKFTYSYSSLNTTTILSGTSNQSYNFGVKFPTSVYKSMDRLLLGRYNDSNILFLNGTIARFTYYPKALSPAQLQFLTQ